MAVSVLSQTSETIIAKSTLNKLVLLFYSRSSNETGAIHALQEYKSFILASEMQAKLVEIISKL